MRAVTVGLLVTAGALGCGDGGACEGAASSASAINPPLPASVVALAQDVRRSGGLVFRGAVVGGRRSLPPLRMVLGPDRVVLVPQVGATVRVTDALGGASTATVDVVSRTGRSSLVDDRGCPAGVVSGAPPSAEQEVPAEGEWVFFVYQVEGQRLMTWRAAVSGDAVSNAGTMTAGAVPIGSLRASN